MKKYLSCLLIGLLPLPLFSQKDVKVLKKALNEYLETYEAPGYRPYNGFQVDSLHLLKEAKHIELYPNESFYSQPFTPELVKRIQKEIQEALPAPFDKFTITVFGKHNRKIEEMIPNLLRKEGKDESRLWGSINYQGAPWVSYISRPFKVTDGLSNRHLMINASHGRYYKYGEWRWQRPYLFSTCEDLFTQSFVYPFLIPMLENAGAVVCSARERDIQTAEAIVDNDPAPLEYDRTFPTGAMKYRSEVGIYQEEGSRKAQWSTVPSEDLCPLPQAVADTLGPMMWAFANPKGLAADSINPFHLGTARKVVTTSSKPNAFATWIPDIPRDGKYAVYVSYATLPNSVDDAHYTIYHSGTKTEIKVNQKMGGGTWVYLGNYHFNSGKSYENRVVLSNASQQEGVVTADAVRFGGGMGQNPRGYAGKSNMPRFLEAARYYCQWAGLPDSLFAIGDTDNDYSDDIRSRSMLLNHLGGGSVYMPTMQGKKVPIELGLGVHSDAGIRRDSTIYGTMSICTTVKHDTVSNYDAGISRMAAMDLSSQILGSVTHDLSQIYQRTWTRRELWDRNYGEARSPQIPAVILEMMSHQNFEDLKYGHDPIFKFNMSRAVYKAILQYVNAQHGKEQVTVQPLPVEHFSALLHPKKMSATLSWSPRTDPLEPTAEAKEYILYTRTGDDDFDNGVNVGNHTKVNVTLLPNLRYDFKVTAVNAGGESFPSEVLSVYKNPNSEKEVLIVNAFERLSGPKRVEYPDSVGFDLLTDMGVPYHYTAAYCGPQLDFNPEYQGQEGAGALGYSSNEWEGKVLMGNTFDFAAEHGRAIAACGRYSYSSISRGAFEEEEAKLNRYDVIDYIAGLEKDVPYNLRPYKTFPAATRELLTDYLEKGGNLLVSGSYIGSDMQSEEERAFTHNVLKYDFTGTAQADSTDFVKGLNLEIPIFRTPNSTHYSAQEPDAIYPASNAAFSAFLYGGGQVAGIAYPGKDYRVLAMGFPFECISHPAVQAQAMQAIIQFLTTKE